MDSYEVSGSCEVQMGKDRRIDPWEWIIDFAKENDKSLVWVYQSMVLSGLGNYIDMDSDIYQASLMAFVDVISIVNSDKREQLPFFEDMCILEGHLYDDMLFIEKNIKVRKLDN